jgi:ubiquitin-protein ligase
MDARIRRFEKERHIIPTIQVNETYQNMPFALDATLTIPTNYPFVPPLLKMNDMFYIRYLENEFKPLKPFLDQYKIKTYNCCLCCSSITGENWSPCYGIKEVLNEYNYYNSLLKIIQKTKLCLENINMDDLVNSIIISYLF